jgi:asparagine synthase (glutamine-hydrolysing)|tara:strand:- start:210 stop:2108 length:1899 start_codon:yes stop_codon:yes gene_type:complete
MTGILSHRGPDDSGYHVEKNISLGHRRLSIIDLSKKGKQPIYNEDESICIVYNGEIYNFKEIKSKLEERGHRFNSDTDTEVIVHAYEEYGEKCLQYFNGMFAFTIWDSKQKKIFVAVDRLGIKPLYYTKIGNRFLFASEIKSLLQYKDLKREVNKKGLIDYLTFRYTPTEQTIFEGIKKLKPGHFLVYKKNKIQINRYWDVNINRISKKPIAYYEKLVLKNLKQSVKRRLISDVPLGAHLSGGLDSSIIVAMMKTLVDTDIKTFSVSFEAEEPFNESRYSNMLADYYGTDHHELVVKSDTMKLLPEVIWHLDDIDSDPTLIAQYLLSEYTRKKVKVVLTGEGADELFGGYDEFRFLTLSEKYMKSIPGIMRKKIIPGIIRNTPNRILDHYFHFTSSLGEKGKERFEEFMESTGNREKSYLTLSSFFSREEKEELYSKKLMDFERENADYIEQIKPFFANANKENILNKLIYLDLKRRLPYHLLHKTDKMTMAHSLEGRVPFLDHNLVEFSFEIPPNYKFNGNIQKYILRKAVKNLIPKEILNRKKHPFVVPLGNWYKENLKELAEMVLSKTNIGHGYYFNYEPIKKIMRNYNKSKLYYGRQIWSLISFDIWHKIYIEQDNLKNPNLSLNKLY